MKPPFSKTKLVQIANEINLYAKHEIITSPAKQSHETLYTNVLNALQCRLGSGSVVESVQTCKKTHAISAAEINQTVDKYFKPKYTDFEYLGTLPVDFIKITPQYEDIKLDKRKRYAAIFNTGVYNSPGKHWIALFIDMPMKIMCFFDSFGNAAPRPINEWINKICSRYGMKRIDNKTVHQIANWECGIYALYFIQLRLAGKSCNDINKMKLGDHKMLMIRNRFQL